MRAKDKGNKMTSASHTHFTDISLQFRIHLFRLDKVFSSCVQILLQLRCMTRQGGQALLHLALFPCLPVYDFLQLQHFGKILVVQGAIRRSLKSIALWQSVWHTSRKTGTLRGTCMLPRGHRLCHCSPTASRGKPKPNTPQKKVKDLPCHWCLVCSPVHGFHQPFHLLVFSSDYSVL